MSPLPVDHEAATTSPASHITRAVIHLFTRDDDDAKCHPQPNIDLCEKPDSAKQTSTIVIGTLAAVLVVATLSILTIFHLRRKRRDELEWPKNNQELDDYGVGPMPPSQPSKPKNTYRKPRVEDDDDIKSGANLPPPRRRDSLTSLARSIRGDPDAYRSRPDDTSHDMKPVEPLSQL
ncbi:uncharacterized protein F4822DRAFT_359616 [Hypoxylon trugodes]|uniref:uncharacterized protein n=1 Tax=Hypoxylon trugodes TaxID=326681 RepID=UPI0021A01704|nr:uncharacterized protein F4822DRAFT_359616 [Hypoxylon trugodes]KAI1386002.1 hypothetical protein F4822DRAFT_359616 [Hypoxylon trugodes]